MPVPPGAGVPGFDRASDLGEPSVHRQLDAVDEAAVIGGEEEHGSSDVLGKPEPAGGDRFEPVTPRL
jgi:hypothetical protein